MATVFHSTNSCEFFILKGASNGVREKSHLKILKVKHKGILQEIMENNGIHFTQNYNHWALPVNRQLL